MASYLAVDIGASSGRHILGRLEDGRLRLEELYRFDNGPVEQDGHKCWDVDTLEQHLLAGMRACAAAGHRPVSIAVDTWGCDYVLLDAAGRRMGPAIAYRDARTKGMDAVVEQRLPFEALYGITGIQKLRFNTVYQLAAQQHSDPAALPAASRLLMMPDYLHYRLSGVASNEYTIATTTALVDAQNRNWSAELLGTLGYPQKLFGQLAAPGTRLGPLRPEVAAQAGFNCAVVLPAAHDTGSAFLAVPAQGDDAVTLSSGTWSLLGTESDTPIITDAAREANFTNEGGYRYRTRFLKNIMGLWMIQSVRRELGRQDYSFARLEALARENAGFESVVDAEDEAFLAPDSMIAAVKEACRKSGQRVPATTGEVMQCIYRSLARCYRDAIRKMEDLTGRRFTSINIVGGGSQDRYLNQLTATAAGLPVWAGPTEGTVIGNLLVQMIADGVFPGIAEARRAVADSFELEVFQP